MPSHHDCWTSVILLWETPSLRMYLCSYAVTDNYVITQIKSGEYNFYPSLLAVPFTGTNFLFQSTTTMVLPVPPRIATVG